MLDRLKYFISVAGAGSFSKAAEECHISQSAISQQIQSLERELSVKLIERRGRGFSLTPAGEYFYRHGSVLVSDYEKLIKETARITSDEDVKFRIGYLKSYGGLEFKTALAEFSAKYPDIEIEILPGNHEELYELLRTDRADIVFNDQRRAFSNEYVNVVLASLPTFAETSNSELFKDKSKINAEDLRDFHCILISSKGQRENEENYYREIYGIESKIIFAENMDEARLCLIASKSFLPIEIGSSLNKQTEDTIFIPLCRNNHPIIRNYCAFWKKDNSAYYIEDFADILKSAFTEDSR